MSGKGDRPRHDLKAYRDAPYWKAKETLDQTGPVMTGSTSKTCTCRNHGSEAQSGHSFKMDAPVKSRRMRQAHESETEDAGASIDFDRQSRDTAMRPCRGSVASHAIDVIRTGHWRGRGVEDLMTHNLGNPCSEKGMHTRSCHQFNHEQIRQDPN